MTIIDRPGRHRGLPASLKASVRADVQPVGLVGRWAESLHSVLSSHGYVVPRSRGAVLDQVRSPLLPGETISRPPARLSDARQIVVDPLTSMVEARGVWSSAAQESDNIFSTWEWADVWWQHFGGGRRLQLAHVHDGAGRELAVLPLHSELRAGVRLTRFLGHGVADQLGPVCRARDAAAVAQALNTASADADVLVAERLPEGRD